MANVRKVADSLGLDIDNPTLSFTYFQIMEPANKFIDSGDWNGSFLAAVQIKKEIPKLTCQQE